MPERPNALIRRIELGAALAVTAVAVYFHAIFFNHAGALWRDEVSSVQVATRPAVVEVWQSLKYESFPMLSYGVVRTWAQLGLAQTDVGFRVLGLVVGLSLVGCLWLGANLLGNAVPIISLVLLALNPWMIRFGDSMRGYGLGTLFIVLTYGLVWKVVESPRPLRILAAAAAAVLSVQSLYQNAFLLFAICVGAMVVSLRNRMWKPTALIAMIGGLAAASLLPYLQVIRDAQEIVLVAQSPAAFTWILGVLMQALDAGTGFLAWTWTGLFVFCGMTAARLQFPSSREPLDRTRKDRALFCAVTMTAGTIGFLAFAKNTKFPTQPWYFLPLMGLVAVSVDAALGIMTNTNARKVGRFAVAVLIAGAAIAPARPQLAVRQTNLDVVASALEQWATKDDFIVVNPWYCGITFRRYYKGATPWTTLPHIEDLSLHRYDQMAQAMSSTEQIQPVLAQIAETLRSGGRVWFVGGVSSVPAGQRPPPTPPPPHPQWAWNNSAYSRAWSLQTGFFLQQHGVRIGEVPVPVEDRVNPYENLPLVMVQGWR